MSMEVEKLYLKMRRATELVSSNGECWVVYKEPIDEDEADAYFELLNKGYVYRTHIGFKKVSKLGSCKGGYFKDYIEVKEVNVDVVEDTKESLLKDFSPEVRSLIEEVFRAFATIRKNGKVSENILIGELKFYKKYSEDIVAESLADYLEKGCYREAKGEEYARGFIRNNFKKTRLKDEEEDPLDSWKKREESADEVIELSYERQRLIDLLVEIAMKERGIGMDRIAELAREAENAVAADEKMKGPVYWRRGDLLKNYSVKLEMLENNANQN